MTTKVKRSAKEGIGFGILAGLIFALVEIIAAAAMGNPVFGPFRMFASIVLGSAALQTVSLGTAIIVGSFVHVVLSGLFGLAYGLFNSRLSTETETSWSRQVLLGLAFGGLVWLVNFQIIARIAYPWFLNAPQFLQLVMHALFFGVSLAIMYAAAARRVQHLPGVTA
ncbi:MAG: hypothetical protein ACOC1F_03865 [Myxococcota bacterium]